MLSVPLVWVAWGEWSGDAHRLRILDLQTLQERTRTIQALRGRVSLPGGLVQTLSPTHAQPRVYALVLYTTVNQYPLARQTVPMGTLSPRTPGIQGIPRTQWALTTLLKACRSKGIL